MQPIEAYPLSWPPGWKRTLPAQRRQSSYKVDLAKARDELVHEVELMGVRRHDIVLSSNVPTRGDGLLYAKWREPDDPGVAVYWSKSRWDKNTRTERFEQRVIACDKWRTVRENVRALGLAVEALRMLERTGSSEILDRAFSGFVPELPGKVEEDWRSVLGFKGIHVTVEDVNERYRELSLEAHPDRGGDHDAMVRLNAARDAALKFMGIG
jgi:hypothetical protein